MRSHFFAGLALVLPLLCSAPIVYADDGLLLSTQAERILPGTGHSWGFAAVDPTRPYLFIARRENGLSVFDVERQALVQTLPGSVGANAVAFVPKRNRAYVANMDGSLGVIALDSLKVLQRLPVDAGNLNNLVYDAQSNRLIITSGRRGDHSTLYFLDPASDRIVGQRDIAGRKLDGPIGLADGTFVVPLRDENQIALLSGPGLAQQRLLSYAQCQQPSALAADEDGGHLFIACRGAQPVLVIADLRSGVQQGVVPITRAVNSMAFDAQHQRVLIASGVDANVSVVERDTAGQYRVRGAVSTAPWAHNMVFDAKRGQAYVLSMAFSQAAPSAAQPKPEPQFHPDSFKVLTLKALPSKQQ